jgi:hypothetical protein
MMKLVVTFELPLTEDRLPYIKTLARHYGWNEERYPEMSADAYICSKVAAPHTKELFKGLIIDGLHAYLGRSHAAQIGEIATQFETDAVTTAEIVDESV